MVATVGLSACASTRYVTTWKSPDAHPIDTEPGATVVGVVAQQDVRATNRDVTFESGA